MLTISVIVKVVSFYWHTVEKVKKDFNTFLDCCQKTNKNIPKQMKLQFDIE